MFTKTMIYSSLFDIDPDFYAPEGNGDFTTKSVGGFDEAVEGTCNPRPNLTILKPSLRTLN